MNDGLDAVEWVWRLRGRQAQEFTLPGQVHDYTPESRDIADDFRHTLHDEPHVLAALDACEKRKSPAFPGAFS